MLDTCACEPIGFHSIWWYCIFLVQKFSWDIKKSDCQNSKILLILVFVSGDLFTFYHGIYHHVSPPFGDFCWFFPSTQQANQSKWRFRLGSPSLKMFHNPGVEKVAFWAGPLGNINYFVGGSVKVSPKIPSQGPTSSTVVTEVFEKASTSSTKTIPDAWANLFFGKEKAGGSFRTSQKSLQLPRFLWRFLCVFYLSLFDVLLSCSCFCWLSQRKFGNTASHETASWKANVFTENRGELLQFFFHLEKETVRTGSFLGYF